MREALAKIERQLPVQKCLGGQEVGALSDHELLAVIIGTGTRESDVVDVAAFLMKEFGGLCGLRRAGLREIARCRGMGLKKSVRIKAALEMGRRILGGEEERSVVSSPSAVWGILRAGILGLDQEHFRVLLLNNKNHLLKNSVVSVGTISEAVIHPREVFRDAIRESASSVIIAHNHPSGVLTPSKEDIASTRRLREAGEIIGIPVLDHVIVTERSFLSMKEGGYL